jgi:hypothetical protein
MCLLYQAHLIVIDSVFTIILYIVKVEIASSYKTVIITSSHSPTSGSVLASIHCDIQ